MKSLLAVGLIALAGVTMAQPAAPRPTEATLRAAFDGKLKDSESARFRDVQFQHQNGAVFLMCGYVNAKNAMGGYAGYTRFIGAAERAGKQTQYVVMEIGGVADTVCTSNGL